MHEYSLAVSNQALSDLIEAKESSRVEFKETLGGNARHRIREAICSFANDLPGSRKPGSIVVGVRDKGEPTSIDITDEMLRALADMRTDGNIVPPPAMHVERRGYRDSNIAVVSVLPSDSPPVRYKGTIHVRSGPRRGIATA